MLEERYLYAEPRQGGRVERIADHIADEMFREFYAEHDSVKARHRHNRRYAMAENKSRHRKGSKYLDFDWCTKHHTTRAEFKAEMRREVAEADVLNGFPAAPCIIFADGELFCLTADSILKAENVMCYCGYIPYNAEYRNGYIEIYCKEVA